VGAVAVIITLVLFFPRNAVCGDMKCEGGLGEDSGNCCIDCGCPEGLHCKITPGGYYCSAECGDGICSLGENHDECCEDCKCPDGESCVEGECIEVVVQMYCENIDYQNEKVRNRAANIASVNQGSYNLLQVFDIYDWISENIAYVSDPNSMESVYHPSETLKSGAGDCDDHAVLLASMLESIGGTAEVLVNYGCGHAYARVLVAVDDEGFEKVQNIVKQRYGEYAMTYWEENGKYWLVLDSAAVSMPGLLPEPCKEKKADYKIRSCK